MTAGTDRHYWAKGTGFGTGSTVSTWNMESMLAKKKEEEKYISLCFAILAEYLAQEEAPPPSLLEAHPPSLLEAPPPFLMEARPPSLLEAPPPSLLEASLPSLGEVCPPEIAEQLSLSALLPALASSLLNDSS